MRRDLIFVSVVLSMPIIFSAALTPSLAVDYTNVGVKVGDTAEYGVSEISHYHGTNYTNAEPVEFYYNETGTLDGFHIYLRVINIERTIVTLNLTYCYPNDTWYDGEVSTIDVSAGNWSVIIPPARNDMFLIWMRDMFRIVLISADLAPGDPIYPGSGNVINRTVNANIAGRYRLINYIGFSEYWPSTEFYWDKESGLLVERNAVDICIMDGLNWGATMVHWLNLTLMPLNVGGHMDAGSQIVTVFAAGATVTVIIVVFVVADRRVHAQKH